MNEIARRPRSRPIRRRAFVQAFALVFVAFALTVSGASAGRAWCRTDPLIMVNGVVADVFVAGPLTAPLKVTGPTQIVVTVPDGVNAVLVLTDLGFGRGETVTFVHSSDLQVTAKGIEMRIDVYVPARDSSMPVMIEFAPRILGILWPASAEGTANSWIHLRVDL